MTSRSATIAALVFCAGLTMPAPAIAAPSDSPTKKAAPGRTAPKATPKNDAAAPKRDATAESAPRATPAQRAEVARVKAVYIFAANSCTPGAKCDPALIKDAEYQFMRACEACTTTARCEEERERILKGDAKRRVNPCD